MARVIVILILMLAIAAAMFAITRTSAIAPGEAASEPSATVRLTDTLDAAIDQDAESIKSAEPRTFSNEVAPANAAPGAATASSAQDVTSGAVAGAAPSFGTAGVDHMGNASFTGTATPGDAISLISRGKTVGSTKADDAGNWALGFKTGKSDQQQELLVSAQSSDGTTVIGPQRALIRPPATEGGLPRITLKSADQTAATLQEGIVPVPEATTGLVVEKVAPGDGALTLLNGQADPGATVRVAINGKAAGETTVAADGTWSLAASNISAKAAEKIHLELIDKDGAQLDETSVPYKVPAPPKLAATTTTKLDYPSILTSKPGPKPKPQREANGDVAALFEPGSSAIAGEATKNTIVKVRRGDSLWRISRRHLGKGKKWAAFYKANKAKIDNPDLIYPGQILIIPG